MAITNKVKNEERTIKIKMVNIRKIVLDSDNNFLVDDGSGDYTVISGQREMFIYKDTILFSI